MTQDELIQYVLWIAFFLLVSGGLYFLFKSLGVLG